MKYMIVLLLALFSTLSIAQETAPFTPDQEKQIENLIHAALFNDPASPRIGAKHPKLTLVNFTDYNCPYCKQLDPMLEKIVQKYPDVAVIIKPLPFKGESSILAARIALTTWRDHPQQFLALHEKLWGGNYFCTDRRCYKLIVKSTTTRPMGDLGILHCAEKNDLKMIFLP